MQTQNPDEAGAFLQVDPIKLHIQNPDEAGAFLQVDCFRCGSQQCVGTTSCEFQQSVGAT